MPKGPRGEKRPADVIGAAVKVMRIATGEETEELETDQVKSAAAELRHYRMTSELASLASPRLRWGSPSPPPSRKHMTMRI